MVGNSAASITEAHSAAERSLISNTKCTTSENGREQISQFFQRLRGELVVPTQLYSRPLGTRPEFLPSTRSSVLPGQNARSTAARFRSLRCCDQRAPCPHSFQCIPPAPVNTTRDRLLMRSEHCGSATAWRIPSAVQLLARRRHCRLQEHDHGILLWHLPNLIGFTWRSSG